MVNAKFWAINAVAFLCVVGYAGIYFYLVLTGNVDKVGQRAFWEASPFQAVVLIFAFYLFTEGRMVQRVILAKRLKDDGTAKEYGVINKSYTNLDNNILDRIPVIGNKKE